MKKCCTWIDGTRIQLKNMQIIMLFCLLFRGLLSEDCLYFWIQWFAVYLQKAAELCWGLRDDLFVACWKARSCGAWTPAFIQLVFPDEGHCLYLGNDSPLFSFIPAHPHPPICHTGAWVRECDTSEDGEQICCEEENWEGKRKRWRQKEGSKMG